MLEHEVRGKVRGKMERKTSFWGIVWVIGKYCLTLRLKSCEDAGAWQMERVPLRSLKRIRGIYVLKRC